ncbi:valine--tRNA ligase [Candidatus Micrarchaeota archaeon]|nr:valine--tRNA ligase [Candidatus Micrarchaeota archaeon]
MLGKRYDIEIEKKWQEEWENHNVYKFDKDNKTKPIFSIDTPPPFTSGKLHMGHVLSYSYFDFVARYKRMKGYNVFYPQGWDCQGFPTEVRVEEKYKIQGSNDPAKFVELCKEWSEKMIVLMRQQMKEMGFSPDWSYEYKTIDPEFHKTVQYSLLTMYKNGQVYNAEHPVYWCTDCVSAIAKSETEDIERDTKLYHIKFLAGVDEGHIPIATTRPEYLHACVAVMVHPEDERYTHLVGKEIKTPLGKPVKIIADKDVDKEFGTGIVMVCTFGDKQDVVWSYRHLLPIVKALDEQGKLINSDFDGLKVGEAKQKIIEKLKQEGNLIKVETLKQVVKVHDRCKHPIELLQSRQWFIKTKDQRRDIVNAAKQIKWYPEFGITYLENWAEFIEWDWVISRNRTYGTPIPFWFCETCNKWHPASEEDLPVDPRIQKKKCPSCNADMQGEQTVLDVWVDSSITPLYIAGWPKNLNKNLYPVDLRPQGVEIVRTWAYYTIARCLALSDQIPFKEVLLNGNVLAPDGKKMSKSTGNVIEPTQILQDYSTDSIRQWAAMSGAMAKDRAFNYQDMKFAKGFLTKVWNTARFIEMHIKDYEYDDTHTEYLKSVDRWVLSELHSLVNGVTEHMDKYEFHHAIKKIQEFTWHILCDYYLELVKYRLYGDDEKSKQAARYVLFNVLLNVSKLLAPFTPHISEEMYQIFYPATDNFVVKSDWPIAYAEWYSPKDLKKGEYIIQIMNKINEWKAQNNLSMKAEVPKLILKIGKNKLGLQMNIDDILEDIQQTGHVQKIIKEPTDSEGIEVEIK